MREFFAESLGMEVEKTSKNISVWSEKVRKLKELGVEFAFSKFLIIN